MVLGLELLLELLESSIVKHQRDASAALYKLANEASSLSHIDAAPPSPVSQVFFLGQFILLCYDLTYNIIEFHCNEWELHCDFLYGYNFGIYEINFFHFLFLYV